MDKNYIKKELELCIKNCEKKPGYINIKNLDEAIIVAEKIKPILLKQAETNGRLRAINTLHPMNDKNESFSPTNVMFNYILKGTWVPPHTHEHKDTYYYIVSGKMAFMIFDENNNPTPIIVKKGNFYLIEKGVKHSDFIIEDHCYVISGKNGGYDPITDKTFVDESYPLEIKDENNVWTTNWDKVKEIHNKWNNLI